MRFPRSSLVLLAGAACVVAPSFSATAGSSPRPSPDAASTTFAMIGDIPYGVAQIEMFPGVIDALNADPDVEWVGHVGDIKSGSTVCSDDYFDWVRSEFDRLADPLVYTPGDNEWTDCHRTNNGSYDPYERLDAIRDVFFADRNRTLGSPMRVTSQWQQGFVENVRFRAGGVTFAAVHVVGSNNGLLPWTGASEPNEQQLAEVDARIAAGSKLISQAFGNAREEGSSLVVLMMQADMFIPAVTNPVPADWSGFTRIVQTIAHEAAAFDGEVLLLDGDSHTFVEDQPLLPGSPWLATYGIDPVENLTRITVEGSGGVDEYLEVTASIDGFSYERVPFTP